MSANYTPGFDPAKHMTELRFWCQKILPLVYDDSLSYYELLCKVVNTLNDIIKNSDNTNSNVTNLYNAFVQLQDYVNHYFDSLDVQEQIENALRKFINDGAFNDTISLAVDGECILIGDSYGSEIESGANNWVNTCADIMGVPCYKSATGGAGFVTSGIFTKFATLLERAVTPNPANIRKIIVCGGANDIGISGVKTAIADFVTYAKNLYPNATVYVGFIAALKGDYDYQSMRKTYQDYVEGIISAGGIYLHGVEDININYGELTDHTHPNSNASIKLGKGIAEAVKCGYTTPVDYNTITSTTSSDYPNMSGDVNAWQVGKKICAFWNSNTFGKPIEFTVNEPMSNFVNGKVVGYLAQDGIFYPTGYGIYVRIPIMVSVNYEHYVVPGTLKIVDGEIIVSLKPCNGLSADSQILAIYIDNIYLEYNNLG